MSLICDSISTIKITKNHVQHSRTNHIKIKHHFIRDHVEKGDISLDFIPTEEHLANVFTRSLNEE